MIILFSLIRKTYNVILLFVNRRIKRFLFEKYLYSIYYYIIKARRIRR